MAAAAPCFPLQVRHPQGLHTSGFSLQSLAEGVEYIWEPLLRPFKVKTLEIIPFTTLIILTAFLLGCTSQKNFSGGINKKEAIQIAKTTIRTEFNERPMSYRPLIAKLQNDSIWFVVGTLVRNKDRITLQYKSGEISKNKFISKFRPGGVPYIIISKKTGTVISFWHDK